MLWRNDRTRVLFGGVMRKKGCQGVKDDFQVHGINNLMDGGTIHESGKIGGADLEKRS